MKYYSTKSTNKFTSASESAILGLPPDNGLYMPETIPHLSSDFFSNIKKMSLSEKAFHILAPYFEPDFTKEEIKKIVEETFNFEIPLVKITDRVFSLELYHGPTLAFKDVGARFLARCLNAISKNEKQKLTVLVATSGDTGSAVAHGFYGLDHVDVIILYPDGRVSDLQERQMTCLGKNITALKVKGSFDDCQNMVKKAFLDNELRSQISLTSANSINIARFLPQSVYYYHAISQLENEGKEGKVAISVPSGNYGNMTAGLFAKLTGLKIDQFIASSNANKIFPDYLNSGIYSPKPSVKTLSNAMDVGDPSNFQRLERLFNLYPELKSTITGFSFSDNETMKCIDKTYKDTGYILDPHGAVGLLGLETFLEKNQDYTGVFLETAHPVKFNETVEKVLDKTLEIPEQLQDVLDRDKKFIPLDNDYEAFRTFLMER
ncbi:MAG: threonine synthase [Cyclobacteriaceae bacterium]|nr:threonine synthase [Cyclobacteriaceae bacterium]